MRIATRFTALAAAALVAVAGPAGGQSLSGNLTVDNVFNAYLSTSATSLGTLLGSGSNWAATYNIATPLVAGTNYWLVIEAIDQGAPGAFLGDFTLTGAFRFGNGASSLLTDDTPEWTVRDATVNGAIIGTLDRGVNGVGPWGALAGIDANAHWIWGDPACGSCTLYISTPIVAQGVSAVPEPGTWALLATGLVGLGAAARRRREA